MRWRGFVSGRDVENVTRVRRRSDLRCAPVALPLITSAPAWGGAWRAGLPLQARGNAPAWGVGRGFPVWADGWKGVWTASGIGRIVGGENPRCMKKTKCGRLVVLSGPSCVGKSPLVKALGTFYPEVREGLRGLVLYNTRAPRPGERDGVDYHFCRREEIEKLRERAGYVVMDVRGDVQALDMDELQGWLAEGDVIYEGNPYVGTALLGAEGLREVRKLGVFLSPLGAEEVEHLLQQPGVSLPELVTDVMRRKLLRRMQRQKGLLSQKDLEEVERRAGSAYGEMKLAREFQYVIPNHDGEDSEHWNAFYHPLGDARKVLKAFVLLLKGEEPPGLEDWKFVRLG